MSFLDDFWGRFTKADTALAFLVSFGLLWGMDGKVWKALCFSTLFVVVFLFLLTTWTRR